MPDSLEELFDTRAAFQRAVDTVLPLAKKEICVFDADLRNLEFDARVRADMISAFLAGGRDRSVRMVLHELDHVTRFSPRLVGLLKRSGRTDEEVREELVRAIEEWCRALGAAR